MSVKDMYVEDETPITNMIIISQHIINTFMVNTLIISTLMVNTHHRLGQ